MSECNIASSLISKSKIPQGEQAAFLAGLKAMAGRLGVSEHDLSVLFLTETGVEGVIDPSANNGSCGGLIQFCSFGGVQVVAQRWPEYNSAAAISALSATEQIPLVEYYLSSVFKEQGGKPGSLADLYLSVLYPAAIGDSRDTILSDKYSDLRVGKQSAHLYNNGQMTKASLEAGLYAKAGLSGSNSNCPSPKGTSSVSLPPSIPTASSSSGGIGGSVGGIGFTSGGECGSFDFIASSAKIHCGRLIESITSLGIPQGVSSAPSAGIIPGVPSDKETKGNKIVPEGKYANPLPGSHMEVTSPFGNRVHPITGDLRLHSGVDLGAANGTPVLAAKEGVVTYAQVSGSLTSGYGNLAIVKHPDGTETYYAHMEGFNVKEGDKVTTGQQLGRVGSTGSSTGSHLHFEVRRDGVPVDPENLISP
jgi:murein DD-endopeptidase MepM/ murein hydrolase activator NlpD